MDWYDVRTFLSELKIARDFLFEVAAHQEELSVVGLRGLTRLKGYNEAMGIFPTIESKMISCERIAGFVDANIASRLNQINSQGFLLGHATDLAIAVKLDAVRRPFPGPTGVLLKASKLLARSFGVAALRGVFEDTGVIPVRKMLADLERTIPFIEQLESVYFKRVSNDEEVFKPSNVDVVQVNAFIDKAMFQIQSNVQIDASTRVRLEGYLSEAKTELAQDAPAWKKVVGALVIVSAILGGIGVAPQAFENVNSAVRYILGTSIDSIGPQPSLGPSLLPKAEDA